MPLLNKGKAETEVKSGQKETKMRKAAILRMAGVTAGVMLAALGALNYGVPLRRARASSVLTVTNTNDSGPGSLRQAVIDANSGDTITFNLFNGSLSSTITLTSGEIDVNKNLKIVGPGANQLTVSGNNSSRVFLTFGTVVISGLTIANGAAQDFFGGGGIINDGGLLVVGCVLRGNNCSGQGQFAGGAIASDGLLAIANCSFIGNSAPSSGAIYSNDFAFQVINSTFSGNSATIGGAGGLGLFGSENTVVNCTIAGNSIHFIGAGGGLFIESLPTLSLENTIIAGNIGGDCATDQGFQLNINSHNLIQDGSCGPLTAGDPKLGPLQNNGGPTPTMAPVLGSPAIDNGDDSALGLPFSLTTDQRGPGFPRKAGAHVDIGAFEVQAPVPVGPSFDTCLKDNTTGNLLQWNRTTGQYQFTRCSDGFTLTGTGTIALVNGIRTLTDFKSDRRISAGYNTGQLTGNATVYLMVTQGVWQTFRVIDTNPSAVCKC